MIWKIKVITGNLSYEEAETLLFAGEELKKYISLVTDEQIVFCKMKEWDEDGIAIGVNLCDEMPEVEDPKLDDGILININNRRGIITGVNHRAVLIAVYRYLKEQGFIFLRPGKDGEVLPDNFVPKDIFIKEVPYCRMRGIGIEGSVFYESLEDLIDWMPKVGMNHYAFQLFVPGFIYRRWYGRGGMSINPYLQVEALSHEDMAGMVNMHLSQIKKRGMTCYNGGHGSTTGAFGLPAGISTQEAEKIMPAQMKENFALLDGERKIFGNSITYTQLCYSNAEVRSKMADYIVDYCFKNPEIDILGVVFSDGSNNYCECEECQKKNISDWLIMLLNEIDEKMTALGIKTRLTTSLYMHTLWPPKTERIKNKKRIILKFCPYNRHYDVALTAESDCKMVPHIHNKATPPKDPREYVPYLKGWREIFDGEIYVFDYYYYHDFYHRFSHVMLAKMIYTDIMNYKELNFSGLVSCQVQRAFAPTSLGMNIMARTLWNRDIDYETEKNDIFKTEFGKDFMLVSNYLEELALYEPKEGIWHFREPFQSEENAKNCELSMKHIKEFMPIIESHISSITEPREKTSWTNLKFHAEYTYMALDAMLSLAKGVPATEKIEKFIDFVNKNEWEMRNYFDVPLLKEAIVRWRLNDFNKKLESKKND